MLFVRLSGGITWNRYRANTMTVLMFDRCFEGKIRDGTKCLTIRGPRKRSIHGGDQLSLRCWSGKPYRSKQLSILETCCHHVCDIVLRDDAIYFTGESVAKQETVYWASLSRKVVARANGFCSWKAMIDHHKKRGASFPFSGTLIEWEV